MLTALLPGVLVVFFGFRAGGYFAGTPAFAAAALAVLAAARVVAARRPFDGLGPMALIAIGALGTYAAWTLASASWSHSASRAEVEYDRALLYLLAAFVLASAPVSAAHVRWAVRGLAAAGVVVCGAGLVSRVLPHLLPTSSAVNYARLRYPVTYWNALGLLCALTGALCLYLASSDREPRLVRVLAASATPILAVTLFFTFSRGGIAAAAVSIAAYAIVGRPRLLPTALLACAPACAIAVKVAYDANLLASANRTTAAAVAQGHTVAWVVAACCAGAALARAALLRVDDRLAHIALRPAQRRRALVAGLAGLLVSGILAIALGAPAAVRDEYRGFVRDSPVDAAGVRARLSEPGNNGRIGLWNISLDAFREKPLSGTGAGTFAVLWTQHRKTTGEVFDGHSLYLETLGELGIPGLLLVLVLVVAVMAGALRRARGPDRDVYAIAFAVSLGWALHAGIDWDWEMPVVTIIPIALGALACARRPDEAGRGPVPGPVLRILAGLACLLVAVIPTSIAISQGRLNDAAAAFKRGDCSRAIDSALSSVEAADTRPEPFDLIGFCDARIGQPAAAVRALESAVERDPASWQHRYGLALVRANAGLDPRAAARAALRLNPREPLVQRLVWRTRTNDPARWRVFAAGAPLPIR